MHWKNAVSFFVIHYMIEKITRNECWIQDINVSIIKAEDAQLQPKELYQEDYFMKLLVGENIKSLRKSHNITQEELAEMLGISCQSVSRWELGTCYPDMEQLPVLAEIFQVSVDKLLGVDAIMEEKKVNEYLARFQAAINQGKIDDCIAIAREGVAEYPNNYALLNKLMYALFVAGDSTGNIPGWKENMESYDSEILSLGERIIKYCPDQSIRLEATARLAFQHCEMGRRNIGRAIYETLPLQELCLENQIWWGLEQEEKLPFLRKKIMQDYESLRSCIWLLASSRLLSDEDVLSIFHKVFDLENLICDGHLPIDQWGCARMHYELAATHARIGDYENVYRHLSIACESIKAFDQRPDVQSFSSLLLGTVELKKMDFETADSRNHRDIMRESWLSNTDFDCIRNTDAFQEIIKALRD